MTPDRSARPVAGAPDRAPQVRAMFDRIAPRYDLANRVMSLGLDRRWRRRAVALLGASARGEVLDLCAGTLDLSAELLRAGARRVVAVDFSEEMLRAGAPKIPAGAPFQAIAADARDLPLPDASVDGIVCGFGLRNVPQVERAVAECARVLRPGGRLVVLELFQPEGLVARVLQHTWNRWMVPLVGGLLTGFAPAYRYLFESIDAFQTRRRFEALVAEHGMEAEGFNLFPPMAGFVVGRRR